MARIRCLLIGVLLLQHIHIVHSILCYQCTQCPVPFTTNYPYVTVVNNTNFLAQCTTTTTGLGSGSPLVTKGTVFFCPPSPTSPEVQIQCCDSDYCNSSVNVRSSMRILFIVLFIYRFIFF